MSAMQNPPRVLALLLLAAGACVSSGCASSPGSGELADARARLDRYERKYGKLEATKGGNEIRELQRELRGRTMSEVTARLGRPDKVENFGRNESWSYFNAAHDPVSKRQVRQMTVWFAKGVVDEIRASY
jgi:hypothetical protein